MDKRIWTILLSGILFATIFGFIVLAPQKVAAPKGILIWTAASSTAAIDESSLDKYQFTGGILSFKFPKNGTIEARINVLEGDWCYQGDASQLEVTYWDPDGPGTRARVEFRLYRCQKTNGVSYEITSINSNSYPSTTDFVTRTKWFQHSWDFLNNAYFIYISIYRYNVTYNPMTTRVALYYTLL